MSQVRILSPRPLYRLPHGFPPLCVVRHSGLAHDTYTWALPTDDRSAPERRTPTMRSIPYSHRINGRYVYRRRLHFRNIISKHVSLAMRTASPSAARQRSASLSVCFMTVKAKVDWMLETGPALTGEQIEGIFRQALEDELNRLLDDAYANRPWSGAVLDVATEIAQACRNLRRPNRPLSPKDEDQRAIGTPFVG